MGVAPGKKGKSPAAIAGLFALFSDSPTTNAPEISQVDAPENAVPLKSDVTKFKNFGPFARFQKETRSVWYVASCLYRRVPLIANGTSSEPSFGVPRESGR